MRRFLGGDRSFLKLYFLGAAPYERAGPPERHAEPPAKTRFREPDKPVEPARPPPHRAQPAARGRTCSHQDRKPQRDQRRAERQRRRQRDRAGQQGQNAEGLEDELVQHAETRLRERVRASARRISPGSMKGMWLAFFRFYGTPSPSRRTPRRWRPAPAPPRRTGRSGPRACSFRRTARESRKETSPAARHSPRRRPAAANP